MYLPCMVNSRQNFALKFLRSWRSTLLGIWSFAHRSYVNPHVPAVHMNTRMVVTSKRWFGGGADLTPVLDARAAHRWSWLKSIHAAMRAACEDIQVLPIMMLIKSGAINIFSWNIVMSHAALAASFMIILIAVIGMLTLNLHKLLAKPSCIFTHSWSANNWKNLGQLRSAKNS